ncbi:hypothetical protein T265_11440 [Opisthorchis viverrini]|uniref:Uncharacterized protein n=1 Tax=Opisthorchis viverrini TaxID=6198 RepID=A0A074Z9H4_OPIVI|nr:hypothetical protein T265_11440 [Opisthorchis viverrini]KER19900.1 hypothetical protein T265_11440 [Opisthorchis viverrini]
MSWQQWSGRIIDTAESPQSPQNVPRNQRDEAHHPWQMKAGLPLSTAGTMSTLGHSTADEVPRLQKPKYVHNQV